MLSDKKVLFVSHDASRSGAPILLLHLLEWIKKNQLIEFDILLKAGGDLESDFLRLGDVFVLEKKANEKSKIKKIISRFIKKLSAKDSASTLMQLKKRNYDLVYFNTVAANDLIIEIKKLFHSSIICHIHENEFSIKNYFPNSLCPEIVQMIDRFIAVSENTKRSLIDNFSVPSDRVDLCYEFINLESFKNRDFEDAIAVKKRLGIEDGEFIVGAAGTCYWRKGTDLFLQLAYEIKRLDPTNKIRLVWIGGSYEREYQLQLEYELKCYNLEDNIIFAGHKHDPYNYYQIFDVFALMSREDPFPLVCLEAASLSKPILCFDRAGGMPEFICKGGGIAVPYGDTRQMAEEILSLYHDKQKLQVMRARAHETAKGFDVNKSGPEIMRIIESAI